MGKTLTQTKAVNILTSYSGLRAGSQHHFHCSCAFLHHRDSNVKYYISQTLLHPSKGGVGFKIPFGVLVAGTTFNSPLFHLEKRIEVHSRFLLW